LRGSLRDFDDQIPHSGLRIHLERLSPPADTAFAVFVDPNPEDTGPVAVEIEGGGAEAGAVGELEAGPVEAGVGLGKAAVLGEGGGEGQILLLD
jgi:hypothetical protein